MTQAWYIQHNGKTFGPVTAARLKQLAGAAKIDRNTQVRLGHEGKWLKADRLKGLFPAADADPVSVLNAPQPADQSHGARSDQSSPTGKSLSPRKHDAGHPYQPPAPVDLPDSAGSVTFGVYLNHGIRRALRGIWFKPRQTIRWLIVERPARDAIIIAAIAFGLQFIDNCLLTNEFSPIDSGIILAPIGVPISAMIGVVTLYLFGFMHKVVGQAFGGNGDYQSLRTAFAWSLLPTIFSFPFTLLLLLITFVAPSILMVPSWLLNLPFTVLFLWGIAIEVAGISAAHEISILRAIITFVVSVVILGLALMIAAVGAVMITVSMLA